MIFQSHSLFDLEQHLQVVASMGHMSGGIMNWPNSWVCCFVVELHPLREAGGILRFVQPVLSSVLAWIPILRKDLAQSWMWKEQWRWLYAAGEPSRFVVDACSGSVQELPEVLCCEGWTWTRQRLSDDTWLWKVLCANAA